MFKLFFLFNALCICGGNYDNSQYLKEDVDFNHTIRLDGILFINQNTWYVWFNGKMITSQSNHRISHICEVLLVYPDKVILCLETERGKQKITLHFNESVDLMHLL